MMNPELETRIEAYIFAEMSADDRANFEKEIAQSADLQALVAERQELAVLVRRAFIREKVREAQNLSSSAEAETPSGVSGRTVAMQPWRIAMAAAFAAVLAAAAWFFWQQTEKLQADIAQIDHKTAKPGLPTTTPVEATPNTENKPIAAVESPKTDENIKVLTDNPAKKPSKIAQAPIDRNVSPQTYGTETRGVAQPKLKNDKGESVYQAVHQKMDMSRFKGTTFDGFVKLFDEKKFSDAARLLKQMEIPAGQEDARELLLGIASLELGDTNSAVRHLMDVYEPKNAYYAESQWWMALAFCREGKLDAAREIFQKISKLNNHPYRAQAENALKNF